MTILVTGAAGFIGAHLCRELLARGQHVIGVDNLNDYYDVGLKRHRLSWLDSHANFEFYQLNIADRAAMENLAASHKNSLDVIVHLAAQAGVRYSLEHPFAYLESNLTGQLVMLEMARHLPNLKHFVYASSSSVYGSGNPPYTLDHDTDHPVSLYAATKKSGEMMAYSYAHLYGIKATGLRFFTVYGAVGRPDMAYFLFTKAILVGKPIKLFNHGDMKRDFTYIDDIIAGIIGCMDQPPAGHAVYNLGNSSTVTLLEFVEVLEAAIGKKATRVFEDMQPGDVYETAAEISASTRDFGFVPKTSIREGLPVFVKWYRDYYEI